MDKIECGCIYIFWFQINESEDFTNQWVGLEIWD